jgi:hypothetical protein
MAPITIDELRKTATSAHEADLSQRDREDRARKMANKHKLESGEAACALFFVSRMSSMIEGFPSDIDLTCANGHLKGAFLRRSNGKWGVDYPGHGHIYRFTASETRVIEGAMKAMSIEISPASVKAVQSRVGWKLETLAEELVGAAEGVPRHTVEGLFGVGYDVGHMFGFSKEEIVATAFAKAARSLEVDLSAATGTMDICTRLTKSLDLPFLKALIEVGGAKPGLTALFSAVYAGNVEGVEAILSTGLSVDAVGNDGETALHVAANTAVNEHHSGTGIRMAKRLVKLGASLDARDSSGATAADIIENGIVAVKVGTLDAESFDLDDLAELKELLISPQKRQENRIGL